ncbi:MBL fold metallo-hydrolase [Cryptosporangium sp. NPDC051539]|uniref:MBL fold metallo-hydrolase n=1 Tax=Cryptosporangium sp. NPDC051539 TaxID=3363962 RepID=UPI00379BE667
MTVRIDRIVTSGIFALDGGEWEVDNNVWIVGDDSECLVIDAPHEADAIAAAVGGRTVTAIACTHGHNDHINAAVELAGYVGAPILLNPADRMLWDAVYPDRAPDGELADGQTLSVAGVSLEVLATPGHAPGAVCFYAPALDALFSGDTLFSGGPGATGRSYSDFPTIIESIRGRLLDLPASTVVHTGHGDTTTIGAEAPHLQEWIDRGH